MKKILMLLALLPMLVACNTEKQNDGQEEPISGGIHVSPYYVQVYLKADKIVHIKHNKDGIILGATGVSFDGADYCEKFKDVGFNQPISENVTTALLNHFVKIDLVSDSDFDEAHKAGTSLADIAYFAGGSALPFIESKYDKSVAFAWGKDDPEVYKKIAGVGLWYTPGFSPKYIKLQEIDSTSLLLAEPNFGIVFESMPTLSTNHKLTLSVTDCDGNVMRTQFDWESE